MQRQKIVFSLIAGMLSLGILAACSETGPVQSGGLTGGSSSAQSDPGSTAPATSQSGELPPVESRKANTDYAPAFAGQTRVPGVKTQSAYDVSTLTQELDSPWSIKVLPDGRFLVTEKAGKLRIVTSAGEISDPITGFPEVDASSQGGLLDVLVDTDFDQTRLLYFTLAEKTGQGALTAVGKGRLADDESAIEEFAIIYRALPFDGRSAHFGSRLIFDSESNLIVSTGERQSSTNRVKAQSLDNGWGKVLRMTTDGEAVPGNPFIDQADAQPQIYSYGHRNIQGLALHPQTDEIWVSEMGPRGGDELNLVQAGKNYGWPIISYGVEYTGFKIGEGITAQDGMEQPVYYWDPVLAPSGMTFYAAEAIPEWQNNLFIGGLAGEHIARLVLADHRVIGEERLLAEEGQRFRDITEGLDGALYAVTDQGRLYRIGPSK